MKIQSTTPESAEVFQTENQEKQTSKKQEAPALSLFKELIAKITDRNYELGECFTKHITFVSYEENILTWESCADEVCKKSLKHGYSVIKQLVREIFGFETIIKGVPCSKASTSSSPQEEPAEVSSAPTEQTSINGAQSASTIEDVEAPLDASCVTNCNDTTPLEQTNGVDITKEPMIQKAIELFEAKKVTVQSKI